ncbi:MAG TPA: shikimate dehydrogenase [Alphaproteobacteria bacterium]|nr:shikimate dehydrogenase [Alphaproteobacteria bacterium]
MNGPAIKAAVIGWPVAHSQSPRLHSYWLSQHNIAGSYEALPVPPEKLALTLKNLHQSGFIGANLTIPHKEAALALVDHADPMARRIGAVNTVIAHKDGTLAGFNTDAYGFTHNILSVGFHPRARPVVVLGAGGAARAAIVALQDMDVSDIRLVNRTQARAESLAREFGAPVRAVAWNDAASALEGAALLINTTSLGMEGQPPLELSLTYLPREALVSDLVYAPLKTDLLKRAEARGNRILDGLGMLLHQARPAFAAFFGREPQVTEELRRHVLEGQKA